MQKANYLILSILLVGACSCAGEKALLRHGREPLSPRSPKAPITDSPAAVQLREAVAAIHASQYDSALMILQQLREAYPDTPWYKRALFLTETTLIQKGREQEAEAAMLRIRREYAELADYAILNLAEYHYRQRAFTRAASLYEVIATEYPHSTLLVRSTYRRAQALYEAQSYSESALLYETMLNDDPYSDFAAGAAVGLGKALAAGGQGGEAVRAYQNAWIRFPGTLFEMEVERALKELKAAGIPVPAYSPEDFYTRGVNLYAANQYEKAFSAFRFFLEKGPKNSPDRPDALFKSGVSAFMSGKRPEAIASLEMLVKNYPAHPRVPEAMLWAGRSYSRRGEWELAKKKYRRILEGYPKSDWADDALFFMGNIYRELGDFDQAMLCYDRLAREYPGSKYADSAIWWQAWEHYSSGRLKEATEFLRQLVKSYPGSFLVHQAAYWQGRIAEKQNDPAQALAHYRNVRKRGSYTFYGHRAAERIALIEAATPIAGSDGVEVRNVPAATDAAAPLPEDVHQADDAEETPDWAEETRALLEREPAFQKSFELMLVDMKREAAAALWTLEAGKKRKRGAVMGLSKALFELGDYHNSYMLVLRLYERHLDFFANGTPDDLWLLAYPRAYWNSILTHARRYNQDPYFIAAIIRQESQFKMDALSPAGARGLMQVMPATGSQVAQRIRLPGFSGEKLYDADTVIHIGTWYIARLMKRFKGNTILVAAAYNAGPGAVSSWLSPKKEISDPDEFVESIPYSETRGYVKKVLRNHAEYRRIYGKTNGLPQNTVFIMNTSEDDEADEERGFLERN